MYPFGINVIDLYSLNNIIFFDQLILFIRYYILCKDITYVIIGELIINIKFYFSHGHFISFQLI